MAARAEAACAVPCKDGLGEAPLWCPREGRLYWVDVTTPSLSWFEPASGRTRTWPLPKPIGSFALREGGGVFMAFRTGLAFFDPDTGDVEWHREAVNPGEGRFNDGKCDRRGRFWVGSMDRKLERPVGALYRIEAGPSCVEMDRGFALSNGIGWSPDDRVMYFTDTRAHAIYAYDFDLGAGTIANRRVFATLGRPDRGGKPVARPDGLTVDAEGFVWSAQVHGSNITRLDPKGRVDRVVELPVERPTSCAFGGAGLDVLYVTTSTMGLGEAELAKQPLAGSLLAVDVGVKGLPEPRFAG